VQRIGLIAGSGRFPVLFAETARRRGVEVFAVAHRGETDPDLEHAVAGIDWIFPGELDAMIQALKRAGVRQTVMVGGIAKPRLFREFRPDARAMALIARLGQLRDDLVLRGVAAELESEGIAVVSRRCICRIVPSAGSSARGSRAVEEWHDIRFGPCREGDRTVRHRAERRGVEGRRDRRRGRRGTDATIRRAGQLANGPIVLVKVCKPTQDTRYDLPAVGPATIAALAQLQGRALGLEAGRTIILDRAEMIALADAAGIAVVAGDRAGGEG
jgi:DUF1009 family protein